MSTIDIEALKKKLNLVPHEREGGFFYESYRAVDMIPKSGLPDRYPESRSFGTCIYYLLTPGTMSAMHMLQSDEIFHFYIGDPVEMLNLHTDGSGGIIRFGNDVLNGDTLQHVVPHGTWQGSRLVEGGQFALFGVNVNPGFEFADYTHGDRTELIRQYPEFAREIEMLTE